jgi:hypothetical protein
MGELHGWWSEEELIERARALVSWGLCYLGVQEGDMDCQWSMGAWRSGVCLGNVLYFLFTYGL